MKLLLVANWWFHILTQIEGWIGHFAKKGDPYRAPLNRECDNHLVQMILLIRPMDQSPEGSAALGQN